MTRLSNVSLDRFPAQSKLRKGGKKLRSYNMSRRRSVTALLLCTVALALSGLENSARAELLPLKISGGGVAEFIPFSTVPPNNTAVHSIVGHATHLGNHTGQGKVLLEAFTSPATAAFSSAEPVVLTGANGDDLAFHYGRVDLEAAAPGEVTLFPAAEAGKVIAVFVAEFNPLLELCTGRFKQVTGGSFIMIATTGPFVFGAKDPVAYTWEGEGALDWKKKSLNWKGSADGTTAPDPDHPGVDCDDFGGKSSKLGKFTGLGCHTLNADFSFSGYATWTAKNGDSLEVSYTGQLYPSDDPDFPFGFTAALYAEGRTGKLSGATGSSVMTGAFSGVPGEFHFDFDGILHDGKGKPHGKHGRKKKGKKKKK